MARPITITLLGDVADLTASLDEAGREIEGFGSKAAGLATVAGGGIAAGLVLGIGEALEREADSDLLAAQLGATSDEAKRLGEAAGEIYTSGWGDSVTAANESLKALWQQGLIPADATADEMAEIGGRAMDVAAVLGDEVGPTASAVGQMLKTGIADNAEEAFDILVRGTQLGANKAEDLLDTFNEYSTQFRSLGLDGETALGLIQQGLQGGARDADVVADALKEFSIRAIDGSEATAEGFAAIGLSADDMRAKIAAGGPAAEEALGLTLDKLRAIEDPADRSAAAVQLFGSQAEDLGDALYSLDTSTAVDELGNVEGAAAAAGDTMHDNAANRVAEFTRSLETGIVDFLGDKVIPALEDLAAGFEPVISAAQSAATWVLENRTPLLTIAGLITALMLPALISWAVTATTTRIAVITAWLTTTATAVASSTTQALAHWSVVAGWLRAGLQAVISGGIIVAQWILMGLQATIQAARMAAAWLIAMGPVGWIIATIIALAALIWANWDTIKEYTRAAWDWVWEKISGIFEWVKDLFLNFTGPGLLIKHWDTIKQATEDAFESVKEKAKAGIDAVVGFVRDLPGRMLSYLSDVGSAAYDLGAEIISTLGDGISGVVDFASDIGTAVKNAVKGAINGIIDLMNRAIPNSIGWGPASIDLPDNPIPRIRAMGGPAGGWTRVGERGTEEVLLPRGSTVVPNHAMRDPGGVVVNVQTNADPYEIGREVAWALRVAPR